MPHEDAMTDPFASLGAPEPLAAALAARGYQTPTPVQEAVLQENARGRDLLVSARTGSGKTVAFGLAVAPDLLHALPKAKKPLLLLVALLRHHPPLSLQPNEFISAWLARTVCPDSLAVCEKFCRA